ncbi:MAG: sigma-54-dependent Fis family transcriptional regulator [Polyangiaceae bacterium]|nr:sigma-54-dependent Fis family transcriptional regulator [Polyangiaceae bacterium]
MVSFVAENQAMCRLLETAERVAQHDLPVLILGESGTGKELLAQRIVSSSNRARRPFIRVNCAALPAGLAEVELFGHAHGAFTGAHQSRRGIFAEADGGTLLLDEVGELPIDVQAKLLRVLQNGEIQTVGGRRPGEGNGRVDVRIIASTNRDLGAAVDAGTFRADLLYRLSVVVLYIPPLRERPEDIIPLAREFAANYGRKFNLGPITMTPALAARIAAHPWPGNVRELENAIARMIALNSAPVLDLPDWERAQATSLAARWSPATPAAAPAPARDVPSETRDMPADDNGLSLRERIERVEREILADALAAHGGNQSRVARSLNISRVTLAAKIRKYQLRAEADTRESDGEAPQPGGVARRAGGEPQ